MTPFILPREERPKLYVPCGFSHDKRYMVLQEQSLSFWYRDID
jgi:hypothetical protein